MTKRRAEIYIGQSNQGTDHGAMETGRIYLRLNGHSLEMEVSNLHFGAISISLVFLFVSMAAYLLMALVLSLPLLFGQTGF